MTVESRISPGRIIQYNLSVQSSGAVTIALVTNLFGFQPLVFYGLFGGIIVVAGFLTAFRIRRRKTHDMIQATD